MQYMANPFLVSDGCLLMAFTEWRWLWIYGEIFSYRGMSKVIKFTRISTQKITFLSKKNVATFPSRVYISSARGNGNIEISHKKGHRWANLYSRTLVCCRRLYFSQIVWKQQLCSLYALWVKFYSLLPSSQQVRERSYALVTHWAKERLFRCGTF